MLWFISRESHSVCQHRKDKNTPRDIYFLISFLISFNFDVNTLHRTGTEIRVCVCVHMQRVDMQSESLYAELTGILPKHAATLPTMLRGGLKFMRPPTPPSPPWRWQQPGILHWNVKLLTHLYQSGNVSAQRQMSPRTKSEGFYLFF